MSKSVMNDALITPAGIEPHNIDKASLAQTRLKSSDLFNGQQQLYIEHESEVYVLRITKQRKLILTK